MKRSIAFLNVLVVLIISLNPASSYSSSTGNPVVMLDAGVGCVRCAQYQIAVFRDGSVRYHGKSCVNAIGERTTSIPVTDVDALVSEFEKAGFWDRPDDYIAEMQKRGDMITDVSPNVLTLQTESRKKVIRYLLTLLDLQQKVEKTIDSDWIEPNSDLAAKDCY